MNKELQIIITAALPIAELRGSIPLGLFLLGKDEWIKITLLSIFGNMLPVPFILVFLKPVSERLRKIGIFKKFFDWLFERTKKKADLIQKYEAVGLALFVGVPLPMTGAWTGAIAASLFGMRLRYGFLAVACGVLIAAAIVMTLCMAGIMSWEFAT